MSVGKFVSIAFGLLFLAGLVIMGCEGEEGPQGPQGLTGPIGDPGQNRLVIPPADRSFGIMVTNQTESDFKGAALVTVDFDSVVATVADVAAVELDKPPVLNGIDGGASEWGAAPLVVVDLGVLHGDDNGIDQMEVRIGYDIAYIYMLASWTETATGDFTPAADVSKNQWTYDLADSSWSQSGGEDKFFCVWDLNGVTDWDSQGLDAVFDGVFFSTPALGERADLWLWQSTTTGYVDRLADMVIVSDSADGSVLDFGRYFVMENRNGAFPAYMATNSPLGGTDYPLWSFEFANFIDSLEWADQATVPGYVFFTPTVSAADVQAVANFADGTWTLELRRMRNTGNADDVRF